MKSHFLRLVTINILLLVLFCSKGILAQEIISTEMPPVISASPQLKAFEQYGSYGVSEFTGVPNISLPLWTIKSGSLEIPLSLSYFAGGIKVDELSGLYGLKWTLNAGGSISRSTMGNLDDGIYGWLNDDNKLPDDFYLNTINKTICVLDSSWVVDSIPYCVYDFIHEDPIDTIWLYEYDYSFSTATSSQYLYLDELVDINDGCKDGMPDLYYLNTPFSNCKFTFDKNNTPVLMPFNKIRVENKIQGGNKLHGWKIIDENGSYLSYNTQEISEVDINCIYGNSFNLTDCYFPHGISGWMLDTIISKSKTDTIIYEYIDDGYQQNYSTKDSESIMFSEGNFLHGLSKLCDLRRPYKTNNICITSNRHHGQLLSKIITKSEIISFSYKTNEHDGYGCPILDYILIKNRIDNSIIRKFSFIYELKNSRYFLKRLEEYSYNNGFIDNDNPKIFSFDYNSINLPDRNSFAIDRFGYYNGHVGNESFVPNDDYTYYSLHDYGTYKKASDRDVDENYCKAGVLERITYPTEGVTEFVYEPNVVFLTNRQKYLNKDTVISFFYENKNPVREASFAIGENNVDNSILVSTLLSGTQNASIKPYLILKDQNNNFKYRWDCCVMPHQAEMVDLDLEPGIYTFYFYGFHEDDCATISVGNRDILTIGSGDQPSGGLRIKSIVSLSNEGDTLLQKNYNYNVFGTNISSGRYASLESDAFSLIRYKIELDDLLGTNNDTIDCSKPSITYTRHSTLSRVASGHIGYTNVTENIIKGEGMTSTIERVFSMEDDYQLQGPGVVKVPNSPRDTKRGNLLHLIELDSEKEKVRETYSNYSYWYDYESSNYPNCNVVTGIAVKTETRKSECESFIVAKWSEYYNYSEWQYKKQDSIVEYFPEGKVISVRNYYYDNPEHAQLTRILEKNSKQKSLKSMFYYAHDIDGDNNDGITMSSTTLNKIKNSNYLAPVKKEVYEENKLIEGVVNNYNEALLLSSVNALFETAYDTAYFIKEYDAYGNILEIQKKNDVVQTYIWGYNSLYPIGHITNSKKDRVAFTNFEDANISLSTCSEKDWQSGSVVYNGVQSYTGKVACKLKSGYSFFTRKSFPAGKYRLRVWTKSSNGAVNTASVFVGNQNIGTIVAQTQWSLQDITLTVNSPSVIKLLSNSNDFIIDDISLIPYDSQIETYTWLPSVGMSSATDAKGNVVNYIYDGFGRLIMTKDQDGNIIESYEYHFAE